MKMENALLSLLLVPRVSAPPNLGRDIHFVNYEEATLIIVFFYN